MRIKQKIFFFFGKKNSIWPTQKNWDFQNHQFLKFVHENFMEWSLDFCLFLSLRRTASWPYRLSHNSALRINHCLKKHRRLLHSKRNSILRDEATLDQIKLKCPALNCSRHFALYEISLSTTGELSALQCGSFLKFWVDWLQKYPAALKDRQLMTQNQNKFQKS
jgi:hypothetical protein